jgi:ParB-like chromosome segregation protein Spo0J
MTATTPIGQTMESALDGTIGPYGLTIAFQVMPEMDPEDYAELKSDIKANGIHTPVVYDQQDRVVDGHHRLQIADELGLDSDEIPWTQVHVGDPAAGRDMAYRVNTHRRHLTRQQKREALEMSLRADPQLSDRQHAERVGSNRNLAGAVRKDLEAAGDVSRNDTRVGKDGVEQPASKPPRERPTDPEPERAAAVIRPAPQPSRAKQAADEAIERYPDLAAFADNSDRVLATAAALDGYDDTERAVRLDALAKHAAAERRKQANPPPPPVPPDVRALQVFDSANRIGRILDVADLDEVVQVIDADVRDVYFGQFQQTIGHLERLLEAMKSASALRSV